MSPWTVIGWIIVVMLLATPVITLIIWLLKMGENFTKRIRHLLTRNIAPKEGQVWMDNPEYSNPARVRIVSFDAKTGFRVDAYGYYSNFQTEEWKKRVKQKRSYLIKKA